jgi:3D (Asp-Asp-Asp) domain-containing protein
LFKFIISSTYEERNKKQQIQNELEIQRINRQLDDIDSQIKKLHNTIEESNKALKEHQDKNESKALNFDVTAYDLSVQSCGKTIDDPAYGITATGFNLSNHTWLSAKTIAVDPEVIPLGSKVEIKFANEDVQQYNGVYIARDTGSVIKGNRIDLFVGDTRSYQPSSRALQFGRQRAYVKILEEK